MVFLCSCLNVQVIIEKGESRPLPKPQNGLRINVPPALSDVACYESLEFLKSVSFRSSSCRQHRENLYLFVQNNKRSIREPFYNNKGEERNVIAMTFSHEKSFKFRELINFFRLSNRRWDPFSISLCRFSTMLSCRLTKLTSGRLIIA